MANAASHHYLASAERDYPALIIYPFAIGIREPFNVVEGSDYTVSLGHGCSISIGYSVSIPRPEHLRGLSNDELKRLLSKTRHSYQVNKVYQEQLEKIEMFESDEDE